MQCVEELRPEACFDLDEIEALPAFDVPDFMADVPAVAFTFAETVTTSATACTYSVMLVSENPYDGVLCYAQSPLGLFLVAFDGTGNNKEAEGDAPTNITRLWMSYRGKKLYFRGVGSSDTPVWRAMENPSGGLTGLGGADRVKQAWKAVVRHYRRMTDEEIAADPLDIIGFSRGAALARHFANVVKQRGDPRRFGRSFTWFGRSAMFESRIKIEGAPLNIRFLGIFDTVPSFGKPGNHIDLGYNLTIPDNVANVRHAISRDEERDLFPLANIVTGPTRIEKMFAGVHSDVGGGYGNNLDIQFIPLKWMWEEGVKCGVPWDMPAELKGWSPPGGKLQGHQSNVGPIEWKWGVIPLGLADHPVAGWDQVGPTDKQKRPVWIP